MDSFPVVPAVTKLPQFAAGRQWGKLDSKPLVIQALLPPDILRSVSPHMGAVLLFGKNTQQGLSGLEGTR